MMQYAAHVDDLTLASSVGSGLCGLGFERVPSNFVGELLDLGEKTRGLKLPLTREERALL